MLNLKGYIETICKQNELIDKRANRSNCSKKETEVTTRQRISCEQSPSSSTTKSNTSTESTPIIKPANENSTSIIRTRGSALADKFRQHIRRPIVYDIEDEDDKLNKKRKTENNNEYAVFKKRRFDEESPQFKKLGSPSISSSFVRRSSSFKSNKDRFEELPVYKNKDGDYFVAFYTNKYVFSNHFPCPRRFTLEGREFPTSEHYYMYRKALFHNDKKAAEDILKEDCPKAAKRITSEFKNFDVKKWDNVSVDIMRKGVMAKFDQNKELRRELFKTGNATLVEASPRDRRWGVGLDMNDPNIANQAKWRGQNLLGQVLMGVRTSLAAQYSEEFDNLNSSSERLLQHAIAV